MLSIFSMVLGLIALLFIPSSSSSVQYALTSRSVFNFWLAAGLTELMLRARPSFSQRGRASLQTTDCHLFYLGRTSFAADIAQLFQLLARPPQKLFYTSRFFVRVILKGRPSLRQDPQGKVAKADLGARGGKGGGNHQQFTIDRLPLAIDRLQNEN